MMAKAEEVFDSALIAMGNTIERNAAIAAALGLFTWERAKQDVARALPASGTSGAAVGRAVRMAARQLAANSSFVQYIPEDNFILPPSKYSEGTDQAAGEDGLYEELNTVGDEIKAVAGSIKEILAGGGEGGAGDRPDAATRRRGLRSVARGGTSVSRSAERQKRAYKRRRETVLAREKEGVDRKIRRGVEGVSDAAAEIRREMSVEGNRAGYRAEATAKAIEAGTNKVLEAGTNKVLGATGMGNSQGGGWKRLFGWSDNGGSGAATEDPAMAELREATVAMPSLTSDDLLEEKARFVAAIQVCLESPGETWLTADAVAENVNRTVDDDALMDIITTMVCLRDDAQSEMDEIVDREALGGDPTPIKDVIEELRRMESSIGTIVTQAAVAADFEAAEMLRAELLGDGSLIASLDELVRDYEIAKVQQEAAEKAAAEEAARAEAQGEAQAQADAESSAAQEVYMEAEVVDAFVDAVVVQEPPPKPPPFFVDLAPDDDFATGRQPEVIASDVGYRSISADAVEVLLDDDDLEEGIWDGVRDAPDLGDAASMEEEEEEEKEDSLPIRLALRSLDVVLFVVEKTIFVWIPALLTSSGTISERLKKENRNGMGSEGWIILENLDKGLKRY